MKANVGEWKVMDIHTHPGHNKPNVYCMDNAAFTSRYLINDGFDCSGEDPVTLKQAKSMGMKQYHSSNNLRRFVRIGKPELDLLLEKFPNGACHPEGQDKNKKIICPSGDPVNQRDFLKFIQEQAAKNACSKSGLFEEIEVIKHDVYAVQLTGKNSETFETFHEQGGIPEQFAFESPWVQKDGSLQINYLCEGDYVTGWAGTLIPEIYRVEQKARLFLSLLL